MCGPVPLLPSPFLPQILKRAKAILCSEIHLCRLKYATAATKGRGRRLKARQAMQVPPPLPARTSASVTVDSTDISEEEGVTDILDVEEACVLGEGDARHRGREHAFIPTSHLDYSTGFVSLSRSAGALDPSPRLDRAEARAHKRKLLFGSDLILP